MVTVDTHLPKLDGWQTEETCDWSDDPHFCCNLLMVEPAFGRGGGGCRVVPGLPPPPANFTNFPSDYNHRNFRTYQEHPPPWGSKFTKPTPLARCKTPPLPLVSGQAAGGITVCVWGGVLS